MYRKVEGSPHMTSNEASEKYPDSYVLMQLDARNTCDSAGIVLYEGNDGDELFSLQVNLPVPQGVVVEGLNIQGKFCLGGIVVGEYSEF